MKRMMRKVGRSLSRDRFGRKDRSGKNVVNLMVNYLAKNNRVE